MTLVAEWSASLMIEDLVQPAAGYTEK